MKTGEIYLIKYNNNDYYMIKILDIVFRYDDLVTFELIYCPSPAYFGKGRRYFSDLKEFFIKSLKRRDWYKLIREINEKKV